MVSIGEFEIIVLVLLTGGAALSGWLYRHETWFRNVVFPLVQLLTGRDPRGDDLPTDGHIEEAQDRISELEMNVEEVRTEVNELARTQKRHNRETLGYLRKIFSNLDEVEIPEGEFDDDRFFRGENGSGGSGE